MAGDERAVLDRCGNAGAGAGRDVLVHGEFCRRRRRDPRTGAHPSKFSVAIVRPPEHRLTVEVFEKDSKVSDRGVPQVRLGAYRAATDPSGRAEVAMPKGTYDLTVWKVGYETRAGSWTSVRISAFQIEAVIVPPENPDAAWLM